MALATVEASLTGRIAIVTGGVHGLGGAIADALADEGAIVIRTTRSLREQQNADSGPSTLHRQLDVRDSGAVIDLVAAVEKDFGGIDILVANAGISQPGAIEDLGDETWADVIDTNLSGTFRTVRAVAPVMRRAGSGCIITMSSALGSRPTQMAASYCTSKAAIEMFTKIAAIELGSCGIRVNSLAPGVIDIGMGREMAANQVVWPIYAPKLISGRLGSASEIGNAAVFLASDSGSYINGQVLEISGGLRW